MAEPEPELAERTRDDNVRDILATTLKLARELQWELGRLQHVVDNSFPPEEKS